MYDDIINILNLNHSDVQSCTSKKENNRITYYITLTRKEFFCPLCFHKLVLCQDFGLHKCKKFN